MNESHGEKSSEKKQGGDLTPERKNQENRALYEDTIRKGYRERGLSYKKSVVLQHINIDAIFEDRFRDEIKRRGIPVSEENISELIEAFDMAAAETKKYVLGKVREELDHMPP
ncbi:MAG: hypothetical protein AAB882_00865 [Patescibacteria group bacterium]